MRRLLAAAAQVSLTELHLLLIAYRQRAAEKALELLLIQQ
jgi:hypothetical protein